MAKIYVPLRPYFEQVESRYSDDTEAWAQALAVIATELARQAGLPATDDVERGGSPCRQDGTPTGNSRSR